MNTIIYTRVSKTDHSNNVYSISHQETTATKYCKIKKYNILKVFSEYGYSAKTFEYPEWKKLMAYIKSNKNLVQKIVFLRWDRFSRNSYEAQGMIKELNRLNVEVECIEQPLDLEVPENLLLLNIYLALPEVENKQLLNQI